MAEYDGAGFRDNRTINAVVSALSEIPGVWAIILGGSRSRGYCDEYSDVDIGLLTDSGPVDESYIRVVKDLAKSYGDSLIISPPEFAFFDDDRQWVEIHCVSASAWQEALEICETHPGAVEPWHLEILQTCYFLVPLFDPEDRANKLKQKAQIQSDQFWHSYGEKYFKECQELAGRFRQCENLPPLAKAISVPGPLYPIFRTLGAINHCCYTAGWQMEDYIGGFRLKPKGIRERLAGIYTLARYSGEQVKRQGDEYESLMLDIGRLFRDSEEPGEGAMKREMPLPFSDKTIEKRADKELFCVPAWLQTRDDLVSLSARLSKRIYTPPGEISKHAKRGAFCFFQDLLRGVIGSLVEVLLALNNIRVMPLLELDRTICGLPVQPQNGYSRMLEILHCANPVDTLAPLEGLTKETEAIVEGQNQKSRELRE